MNLWCFLSQEQKEKVGMIKIVESCGCGEVMEHLMSSDMICGASVKVNGISFQMIFMESCSMYHKSCVLDMMHVNLL